MTEQTPAAKPAPTPAVASTKSPAKRALVVLGVGVVAVAGAYGMGRIQGKVATDAADKRTGESRSRSRSRAASSTLNAIARCASRPVAACTSRWWRRTSATSASPRATWTRPPHCSSAPWGSRSSPAWRARSRVRSSPPATISAACDSKLMGWVRDFDSALPPAEPCRRVRHPTGAEADTRTPRLAILGESAPAVGFGDATNERQARARGRARARSPRTNFSNTRGKSAGLKPAPASSTSNRSRRSTRRTHRSRWRRRRAACVVEQVRQRAASSVGSADDRGVPGLHAQDLGRQTLALQRPARDGSRASKLRRSSASKSSAGARQELLRPGSRSPGSRARFRHCSFASAPSSRASSASTRSRASGERISWQTAARSSR